MPLNSSSPRLESHNLQSSANGGFGRAALNVGIGVAIIAGATYALLHGCCTPPLLSSANAPLALPA